MKLTPWMLTVAAFGIIAVLAVGFLFKKLMAMPVEEVKPPEAKILPMAITDIEPGTVITRAHVGNGRAELGVKLPEDTFLSLDIVIGRIAREKITAAIPLQGSMFYAPGDFPDLKVSPGKQAVVVKVSQTTAVLSQKMKPEQHVDVLLTVDNLGSGDVTRLQSTGGSVGGDSIGSTSTAMTATLFKGVKILAITMDKRAQLAPALPTINEAGVRGYSVTVWQGVLAPATTPREIVMKLNAAMTEALKKPEISNRLRTQGFEVVTGTPEDFAKYIRDEVGKWEKVVRGAHIVLD